MSTGVLPSSTFIQTKAYCYDSTRTLMLRNSELWKYYPPFDTLWSHIGLYYSRDAVVKMWCSNYKHNISDKYLQTTSIYQDFCFLCCKLKHQWTLDIWIFGHGRMTDDVCMRMQQLRLHKFRVKDENRSDGQASEPSYSIRLNHVDNWGEKKGWSKKNIRMSMMR